MVDNIQKNIFIKFFMIKKKIHRLKQRIIWYYQKFTFDPHFYWVIKQKEWW